MDQLIWTAALYALLPRIGFAVALAVGAPGIVGQIRLGIPVLAQLAGLRASQLDRVLRPFRALGLSCVAAFAILVLLQGKPYVAAAPAVAGGAELTGGEAA